MLVCSFICSRIDYCNAVFASLPRSTTNHLDSVLHAVARMISGHSKHDHITSVLRDELHWLPVPLVIYKLCLTTYKAINGTAPSYIAAMCVPSSTNQARLRLRSSDSSATAPADQNWARKTGLHVCGTSGMERFADRPANINNPHRVQVDP